MKLPIYQVDAFTSRVFAGNPAAVVPLDALAATTRTLQAIAAENNLSETAFIVGGRGRYHIRWMTPTDRGRPVRPRDARLGLGGASNVLEPGKDSVDLRLEERPSAWSRAKATCWPSTFRRARRSRPTAALPALAEALGARAAGGLAPRATTWPSSSPPTRCGPSGPTWRGWSPSTVSR